MARRSARVRFTRPAPKTKIWIGNGLDLTVLASNAATLVSTLSAGALLLRPFTVLRTRIVIHSESDQITATEVPAGVYSR